MKLSSPQEWTQAKLSQVAKIDRKSVQPADILSGTTYVGLEHIDGEGTFNSVQSVDAGDIASSKFTFDSRHLLYGKLRPYLKKIARPAFSGVCSTDIIPILPGKDIDKNFLHYYLRQPQYIELATNRSTGVNLPRLSPKILEEFPVSFPPLEEQKQIAVILDKADAIRRKRKEAIALTEELLRSTFLDMFGDPVINPKGWENISLGKLISFITSGSRGWAKHYSEKGRLFLRIQNVKDGNLLLDDIAFVNPPDSAEARRTLVKEGDVIISITADLGRTAVIPSGLPPTHINQHLALVRVDQEQIDPAYLTAFLSSVGGQIQFDRLNREGVKAGLNFNDIKSLNILVPPLSKQKEYLELKDRHSKISQEYKDVIEQSDSLFNSLLKRAFRGEL